MRENKHNDRKTWQKTTETLSNTWTTQTPQAKPCSPVALCLPFFFQVEAKVPKSPCLVQCARESPAPRWRSRTSVATNDLQWFTVDMIYIIIVLLDIYDSCIIVFTYIYIICDINWYYTYISINCRKSWAMVRVKVLLKETLFSVTYKELMVAVQSGSEISGGGGGIYTSAETQICSIMLYLSIHRSIQFNPIQSSPINQSVNASGPFVIKFWTHERSWKINYWDDWGVGIIWCHVCRGS